MKLLHDSNASKIVYDEQSNIVHKTLKLKTINEHWIRLYKEFQKTASVVKVIDIIDKHTYSMEYIPNIITTVNEFTEHWRPEYSFIKSKNNLINLHSTISESWQSAMRISKTLEGNKFWACGDIKLKNIVVVKGKNNTINFKVMDADSWGVRDGYQGIDTYYQSQLKVALVMQRLV
jgi:hypothetical protein